jgi:hypothetical protein
MAISLDQLQSAVSAKPGVTPTVNALGQVTQGYTTPEYLFSRVFTTLGWVMAIGAFIVILYGAINYITAGGDAEKSEKGKKMIIGAIVGIVIYVCSYLIYSTTVKLFSDRNNGTSTQTQILNEPADQGTGNSGTSGSSSNQAQGDSGVSINTNK